MPKFTFCGDDCGFCPRYRATQSGDDKELRRIAELWYRAGSRPTVLPPEEMICHGCSANNPCPYEIASCATERGVTTCGECDEYPCDRLARAFDSQKSSSGRWKQACSPEEYELVYKAFFQKKENLDRIRLKSSTPGDETRSF